MFLARGVPDVQLEKGSDNDLLREMIGYVAQRLMQLDMKGLVSAGHGERGEGRENGRNGYGDRDWHTRCAAARGRAQIHEFVAEREGFEPPIRCRIPDFESGAFDHSAISPGAGHYTGSHTRRLRGLDAAPGFRRRCGRTGERG